MISGMFSSTRRPSFPKSAIHITFVPRKYYPLPLSLLCRLILLVSFTQHRLHKKEANGSTNDDVPLRACLLGVWLGGRLDGWLLEAKIKKRVYALIMTTTRLEDFNNNLNNFKLTDIKIR
jgi:hypothetical protein